MIATAKRLSFSVKQKKLLQVLEQERGMSKLKETLKYELEGSTKDTFLERSL